MTDTVARLDALIGQDGISEAYIRFRVDLLVAQQAVRRAATAAVNESAETSPLPLGPGDVPWPAAELAALVDAVRDSAVRHGRDTDDLRRLVAGARGHPDRLPGLAIAAAFEPHAGVLETLAREWGVLTDVVLFVGRAMAAPCLAAAVAARPGPADRQIALAANHCPACTSSPSIARLRRADGRRLMTCGLCGTAWEATRLACACCGIEDQSLLGVLRITEDDPRWLETCESCRGYIKTVDERRLPEGDVVSSVIEESASLHMDLLAEREGYVRRVPYVLAG